MSIDEQTFETRAEALLRHWFDQIEAAGADAVEVDLDQGRLTIEVEGAGTFLLNKHAPLRQLWLSSPVGGASHYRFDEAARRWRSTRSEEDLATVLSAELERAAGVAIGLDYPA